MLAASALIALIFLMSTKMMFDQYKLLGMYRKKVNPMFILYAGDFSTVNGKFVAMDNVPQASQRMLRGIFRQRYEDPELDRQAKLVRFEFRLIPLIMITGFFTIVLLMYFENVWGYIPYNWLAEVVLGSLLVLFSDEIARFDINRRNKHRKKKYVEKHWLGSRWVIVLIGCVFIYWGVLGIFNPGA
jgi:hypothetical protein